MSISPSPGASETGFPDQIRRRSHRLSLTRWSLNPQIPEGSITHVDIFLGSLTAISEVLASSLAEHVKRLGAAVTLRSLDQFHPGDCVDPNSVYRSPSRVAVFVVSTHVAGKPSPNAEAFLEWLRAAKNPAHSPAVEPLKSGEIQGPPPASPSLPPKGSSPNFKSPRTLRIHSEGEIHRHLSLTNALLSSLPVNWRHPFGGGVPQAHASNPDGPLFGVQYAVFGVGNSIYRTYNATAKYIDTRLHELGGVRVCPLGLGDVSKAIEIAFAKWEERLLQTVSYQLHTDPVGGSVPGQEPTMLPSHEPLSITTRDIDARVAESLEAVQPALSSQSIELGPVRGGLPRSQTPTFNQRRHSSATTMIIKRRETFDPGTPMPPLACRK
jgi:hypothetical protein